LEFRLAKLHTLTGKGLKDIWGSPSIIREVKYGEQKNSGGINSSSVQ